MPAWFTIYCSRSVGNVSADDIRSGINGWDFHTAAVGYWIDGNDQIDCAVASRNVEPVAGAGGVRFRLTYGPQVRRPILIHFFADPEVIAEERDEALELLGDARGKGKRRIRNHLDEVIEVVMVELGLSQLEDMGIVFADVVSEYLASVGGGLLRDPDDVWWTAEKGIPVRLAGPV
jgi:hypothetical protein